MRRGRKVEDGIPYLQLRLIRRIGRRGPFPVFSPPMFHLVHLELVCR